MDWEELMQTAAAQYAQDKAMLESMSDSLRSGEAFSFNPHDMADLLDRLRKDHIDHMVAS